jgi:aspartyl-tRNA(Asn)/glutamyl-tRNA(Gln) amidotransferase subunit A
LPTSLQFMGRAWEENTILAAARAWQGVTDWHTRRPPALGDHLPPARHAAAGP